MSLQYRGNTLFLIVKVWDIYISCRYILLQKKLDLKVVKLYPLHSQGSFVFVHSIPIISLKMSDSTKKRFYFIQNKFIWNYFYTIGDYNKYLNTIRRIIGRCNRYFRRWLYFNPSGFRYDPKIKRGKASPHKQLKAVSRQPLTNFVNLKSNTIMKKPQCKDTGLSELVKNWDAK